MDDARGRPLKHSQVVNWRTLEVLLLLPLALATVVLLMLLAIFAASGSTWTNPAAALAALGASVGNLLGNGKLVLACLGGLLASVLIDRHVRKRSRPTGLET